MKLLEILLVLDFSVFLCFGIFDKGVTKICFYIGLFLFILIKALKYKRKIIRNFLDKTHLNSAIFLFLGVSLLSVILSADFAHAQKIFFNRYLPYFLFFFLAVFISKNSRYLAALIIAAMSGAFITGVGGIADILRTGRIFEIGSSWGAPCLFGSHFLCVLPFFICFAFFHPNKKVKIISAGGGIPFLICFFAHYSRGVFAGLFLSIFIMTFIFIPHKRQVIIAFLAVLVLILAAPPFRTTLFSLAGDTVASLGDRAVMWRSALNIFKKYPVLGAGPGCYEILMYKFVNPAGFREGFIHLHAHSTYLELLAEVGILGLACFLYIFFLFFKVAIGKLREKLDIYLLPFVAAVLAVLISELTGSAVMVGVFPPALFWSLLGMGVSRPVNILLTKS